jgi:hypothetical protein
MRTSMCLVSLASLTLAGSARAQSFPSDSAWHAFRCGNRPMTDGARDQSAAVDELDLVGDPASPAGFHWSDGQFLYLRLRIDEAPTIGLTLRPLAWGFAFSTNSVHRDYEVLITADGNASGVRLYRNSVTSLDNSPTDPADDPPVASYPFATHGRTVLAESSFRGSRDYFIDMAVPWTALTPLGLGARQSVVVWAASSSTADRLNGDFACHDARGRGDVPDLSGSSSDSTTADGNDGTGGNAGTGSGAGSGGVSLEGGPACSAGATGATGGPAVALLLGLLTWLRTRRHARRA